jgi:hypothetical protein
MLAMLVRVREEAMPDLRKTKRAAALSPPPHAMQA